MVETKDMKEKSINYFDNIIMPMIREKHSDILDEMSFMIGGSVGLGIDDELSDLDSAIWLPDDIWKQNGLLQINLDKCLRETNLWNPCGSGIQVYPLSWILDGKGEKMLNSGNVPWKKLSFDALYGLFVLHNQPIWHDPQDRLGRLRKMTMPEKMPEILWKKKLLEKIQAFVDDGMDEIRRCVNRGHYLDAFIPLGDAVKAMLELGFMVCRQYYPYRKHLSWAFNRLPSPISDLKSNFDLLYAAADWEARLNIMETIYNFYRDYIISNNLLPELDFNRVDLIEMPLHENEFHNASALLDNPNYLNEMATKKEKAISLGHDAKAWWVINWWGIE
ncbi:MAG: DUF4037 domain-containing protein [Oscillospiraceae bacterium]|nr:DUF4037 domain-containing protein [Oscillospiraceae bacterium]